MADSKIIGERLITLRDDRSRQEVATALGISLSALQMYENGKRIPRDEVKVKIAEFYNTSIESIFFTP